MDKVDPMYIFNSKYSLIDLSSDTRLKFSSQEFTDWLANSCMYYLKFIYQSINLYVFIYLIFMYSEFF